MDNIVTIVTHADTHEKLLFDGRPLVDVSWTATAGWSGIMYTSFHVNDGLHRLYNVDHAATFALYSYGHGVDGGKSYGIVTGFSGNFFMKE